MYDYNAEGQGYPVNSEMVASPDSPAMKMIRAGHSGKIKVTVVRNDPSKDEMEDISREIWVEDRIKELPPGFTLMPKERDGTIYYRRGDSVLDFDVELSGDPSINLIVWDPGVLRWIDVHTHSRRRVTAKEQEDVDRGLIDWLLGRGLKFEFRGQVYPRA